MFPVVEIPVVVIPVLESFVFVATMVIIPMASFIIRAVVFVVVTVTVVTVPGRIGIISGAGEFLFIGYRSGCRGTSILVYGCRSISFLVSRCRLINGCGLISVLIDYRNGYRNRQTMNPGKSYTYMCINVHL